jgi:hypothetical protein
MARRSYSYSMGAQVPTQIEFPAEGVEARRKFVLWLQAQPRLQQRTALAGLSHGLFGESAISEPLSPRTTWILDDLGPDFAGQTIEIAATRGQGPLPEVVQIRNRKAKLADLSLNVLPKVQRQAVAWALGFDLGTELARSPEFEDGVMATGPWQEGFEGPLAPHAWSGFSEALGRRWGYSNDIRSRFLAEVPPEWRAAARRGYRDGKEWVFLP